MAEEVVTLASIGGGVALARFDKALQEAIENIVDPNTNPKTPRVINVKITIQPDTERRIGFAKIDVNTKLAGAKPVDCTMYFGKKNGELVAVQQPYAQPSIFDEPRGPNNVTPLTPIAALSAVVMKEGA